jgi:integrase
VSGHIRRRGERSWELKFDLGRDPGTGKRETRYRSFKGTKREAQAELIRLSAEALKGVYIDATTETVGQFLDRWSRDWATPHNLSPTTLERHRSLIDNQVLPHIGQHLIQKLRPAHLAELYGKLSREGHAAGGGLSSRTVGLVHRLLHRALGHAVKWGVVQQNAASLVAPPRVTASEIEIIREDEIMTVLRRLRGRSMYTIAAVALATGMRRGELLGLRWQDVDLNSGTLRVAQSLEQTKAGLRFKSPKTKHGRRTITLPPLIVAELRTHWKAQQEQRLALGLGKAPDTALVFPTWDGKPRSPGALTQEWTRAMKKAGMKVTLHALRHTHASSLIAAGVDILTISRRLGHASPTITLGTYGHLYSNTDDRAAQIMEAMFSKVGTD